MAIKTFDVVVYRSGVGHDLGQVHEENEDLARCAALSQFGIEGERATVHALDRNPVPHVIYEDDEFSVFAR